jgi:hypothetical protein
LIARAEEADGEIEVKETYGKLGTCPGCSGSRGGAQSPARAATQDDSDVRW